MDWLRLALLCGIITLFVALACLGTFAYHSAASRNLGLATATLAAATLLFLVQLPFELRSASARDQFAAEFTIDRGKPSIRQWNYGTAPTAWRMGAEIAASDWLAANSPKAYDGDREKLTSDMIIYSLVFYLQAEHRDWQLQRIRLQGQQWAQETTMRMSKPEECTDISPDQLRELLSKAGNVFAQAPMTVPGQGLCLPPGSLLQVTSTSVILKNPFCEIAFTRIPGTAVLSSVLPGSGGAQSKLPNGEPAFETRLIGVDAVVRYDWVRAPHGDMQKYRDWAGAVIQGAARWFQGV